MVESALREKLVLGKKCSIRKVVRKLLECIWLIQHYSPATTRSGFSPLQLSYVKYITRKVWLKKMPQLDWMDRYRNTKITRKMCISCENAVWMP